MSALSAPMVLIWLDAYKQAWEQQDIARIVGLFSETAHYIESPYEPAMIGREAIARYWQDGAVSGQKDISFSSTLWAVEGRVAFAHWDAQFTRTATGKRVRLDGVFRLSFAPSSDEMPLCERLEEWWFVDDG